MLLLLLMVFFSLSRAPRLQNHAKLAILVTILLLAFTTKHPPGLCIL
jgi:hypothetical protein